ncbi:hypothetical protein BUALT_Bualt01G0183400 [Buddleja alternifolia]|uniref:DDE Tnp4 domain-containing protein n=1 Tax=Buddleja alternifolia TaxID=168488 RepID=A0AAV6YGP1_9LAMI|nr:hypothetical protein BUALT_Bualt01G0183400 [Buddleja alternifolia]
MNFIYMFPCWEGSATDGRVLRNAVNRPIGLKVPTGQYYSVDNGYKNCLRFLAPYRGVRYHLAGGAEGSLAPQNSKARNLIECTWGIMKERWAIHKSMVFYLINTQNQMILACALLYNFIRGEVDVDPLEFIVPDLHQENYSDDHPTDVGFVETMDPCNEWAA